LEGQTQGLAQQPCGHPRSPAPGSRTEPRGAREKRAAEA